MELFASRLRERAAELGISHAEAARRAGLSERRYSHYVTGIREPDLATLLRIAEALQTTPDVLLGVGGGSPANGGALLIDRLCSAARGLTEEDLIVTIVQAEALVAYRRRPRQRKG